MGPTVNPCTKGIYIWGKPLVLERQNDSPLNVLLIDTEGIGSTQQDQTYDVKIFSLAILLSSYFVYNSISVIDERALDGLSLVVNLTKQITAKSNTSSAVGSGGKAKGRSSLGPRNSSDGTSMSSSNGGSSSSGGASSKHRGGTSNMAELAEYFPSFLWLLRDFALDLVDEKSNPITAAQYLENALAERPEASQQSKNAIRNSIKQLFRYRDCVTLVRPVVDEKQLKTIDSIPYSQLRPEFRRESELLVAKILDEAPVKQINGQNLNGESFVQLLMVYTEAINSGAVASIQNAWESVSSQVNQQAMEEAFHVWSSGIKARYNPNRPLGDEQLQALHIDCMNEAFGMFDGMSYNSAQTAAIRKHLKQKMVTEFGHLVQSNREASARFVLRLLAKLYEPLESQAKNGHFKTMDALLEAWSVLRKSYFEELGDAQASRLVAYDEFIKYFATHLATTSAHVMKTIHEKHTSAIEALRAEREQLKAAKHESELNAVQSIAEAKRLKELHEAVQKRSLELEQDRARALEQLTAAQKQVHSLQTTLNKATADNQKFMAEISAAEQRASKDREKLASALDFKLKAQEEHNKQLAAAEKKIENLEERLSASMSAQDKLERSTKEREKTAARTVAERERAASEREKAASEKEKAESGNKEKLRKALEAAESERDAVRSRATELEHELESAANDLDALEAELVKLRAENERAKSAAESDAATKAQSAQNAQVKFLNAEMAKIKAELERERKESASKIKNAVDAQKMASSAQKVTESAHAEAMHTVETLQNEVVSLATRCAELEKMLTEGLQGVESPPTSALAKKASVTTSASAKRASTSSASVAKSSSAAPTPTKLRAKTSATASATTPSSNTLAAKRSAANATNTVSGTPSKSLNAKSAATATPSRAAASSTPYIMEAYDEDVEYEGEEELSHDYEDIARASSTIPGDMLSDDGEYDEFANGGAEDNDNVLYFSAEDETEDETESGSGVAPKKKKVRAKAASKKSSVAAKTTSSAKKSAKTVQEENEEEEVEKPKKARAPAKRASIAVPPSSTASSSSTSATPKTSKVAKRTSMAASTSSSTPSAMDIDIELPPPSSSRKRARASDFSETAEEPAGTPIKKAQNDPLQMDKAQLKSVLTASGVKLPAEDQSKAFYIELYNKKFGRRRG